MNPLRSFVSAVAAALVFSVIAASPAAAQCPNFICYVDLLQGSSICPNDTVYPAAGRDISPIVIGVDNPNCVTGPFAAVVEIEIPSECTGVSVLVEYGGTLDGWTLNLGDSSTNDGFGGDAGTLPAGQNAEVQILDESLSVFSAAETPLDVETLATAHLGLTDGAVRLVVQDQYLSWGQPFSVLQTPDLQRLFFVPVTPSAPANRTLYLGLNRTIAPVGEPNSSRNGCGARHALIFTQ